MTESVVTVTVSGPVGCGKSAIAGEIEIALKAIGVPVTWADPVAAQSEKRRRGTITTSKLKPRAEAGTAAMTVQKPEAPIQTTDRDAAAEHRKALADGMEPSLVRKYVEYHLGRVRTLMPSATRDRSLSDLSIFLMELPHD